MEHSAEPARETLFTLPNLLTLSRLPMAGLVWLRPLDPVYVLGLMAMAGITDILDGWLERRRRGDRPGTGESMGAWLDPLCDKVFIVSLLTAITVSRGLPIWIIPLISLREILQTVIVVATRLIGALRDRLRPRFQANVLGKLTTVAQFITIAAILLDKPGQRTLAGITAGLGLAAVFVYVRRARIGTRTDRASRTVPSAR